MQKKRPIAVYFVKKYTAAEFAVFGELNRALPG
jgi:hypothetical protein